MSEEYKVTRGLSAKSPFVRAYDPLAAPKLVSHLQSKGFVLGATINPYSVSMISLPQNVTPEPEKELQDEIDQWRKDNSK